MTMAMTMTARVSFVPGEAGALALYDWPVPVSTSAPTTAPVRQPRGTVLIVHGLGEHAGRYEEVATHLRQWGFTVRGYDHQGHGRSEGPRGALHSDDGLLRDLGTVIDATRQRPDTGPLILLGHSMGGLLVSRAVGTQLRPVDGLVMSSPALGTWMNGAQQALLAVLPRLLPQLTIPNGLNPKYVARDPAAVAAYRADPLVHDRISARLGGWIHREGPQTLAQASRWQVPSLLIYAGRDKLVRPDACATFARRAPAAVVQSQCFEPMYHEIFNDTQRQQVFDALKGWLDQRFPAD